MDCNLAAMSAEGAVAVAELWQASSAVWLIAAVVLEELTVGIFGVKITKLLIAFPNCPCSLPSLVDRAEPSAAGLQGRDGVWTRHDVVSAALAV
jgi:hypothetical protein